MISPDEAYRHCLDITRNEAKNFYYGIRLLRPPQRKALSAIYALARRIDDIGDGPASTQEKLNKLTQMRSLLEIMPAGPASPAGAVGPSSPDDFVLPAEIADDAVLAGVAYASQQFPIPLDAFGDIITGCEWDNTATEYATIDDTVAYCRLVAGSVGRLSLGVFGSDDPAHCSQLADDLGVALQLTNILRDIAEDSAMGRIYLPQEDIQIFGCALDLSGPKSQVAELVLYEVKRTQEWFQRGFELLGHLDRRSRACVSAMSGIYYSLLRRISKRPEAVLEGRMSVPVWEKSMVAMRSLAGR